MSRMARPSEIAAFSETFAANEAGYTAPDFKQAQVRQQFITPLSAPYGWDIANTADYAECRLVTCNPSLFVVN